MTKGGNSLCEIRRLIFSIFFVCSAALVWGVASGPPAVAAPQNRWVHDTDTVRPATGGIARSEVTFRGGGGLELHGSVVAPTKPEGRARPGMVVLQGSGRGDREDYRREAEAFAREGISTLIYDKRQVGYSLLQRDFSLLADDALGAVRALRRQAGVDLERVGIMGISEGAWVAPLAACRSADVAFVVAVSGGISPARQQAWGYETWLRHRGVSGSLLTSVTSHAVGLTVAAGLFPEADHDPTPPLRRMRQPVLAVWGGLDRASPPREAAALYRAALQEGATSSYTIRIFAGAGHGLRRAREGGFGQDGAFTPGYVAFTGSWVRSAPDQAPPSRVGPLPPQDQLPVPPVDERSGGPLVLQLGLLASLLVTYGGCLLWPGRRVDRSAGGPGGGRWTAAAGLVTVLGTLGYLGFLLATAAQYPGPVFLRRPLPWLALQILAVSAVCSAVVWAVRWWRVRGGGRSMVRPRVVLLLAGTAFFVPWAIYWGLLIP